MPDYTQATSPCFVLDEKRLRRNMEILNNIQERTGVKIICALKGYSFWRSFPIIAEYLPGATASSLNEARLAKEEMGKEVHVFAPAYEDGEIDEILKYADHITYNSFSQWQRFKAKTIASKISAGIRVNPEFSTVETDIYNPCGLHSRLGVTEAEFKPELLDGIEGLHFHALCEQDVDALEGVLAAFEKAQPMAGLPCRPIPTTNSARNRWTRKGNSSRQKFSNVMVPSASPPTNSAWSARHYTTG